MLVKYPLYIVLRQLTMFAKNIESDEKGYLYDISKFLKIWYSPNPDVFLGIENQLRYVRMRHDNPKASLFFIYCKTHLLKKARDDLKRFCDDYSISPVALEDLECLLVTPKDKALYVLIKEEIRRALNNTGGNLAAASDMTRHLEYVILTYSIYTDFDVSTSLSQLDTQGKNYVTLRGPILYNSELIRCDYKYLNLYTNTDFLAFGLDATNPSALSEDALIAIHAIQTAILKNYEPPFDLNIFGQERIKDMINEHPQIPQLFEEFRVQYPENPTIFDFRMYLSTLPNPNKQSMSNFLIRRSVIYISGPGACRAYFKNLLPEGCSDQPVFIPYQEQQWRPFLKMVERCLIGFYKQFDDFIDCKNRTSNTLKGKKERLADASWTTKGVIAQQDREAKLFKSAVTLQQAYRRHRLWKEHPHESLFVKIKAISADKSLLTALIEHQYAFVLRKASSQLMHQIIKLLLEYKAGKGIIFEVNEPSTNHNTALDWAIKAKPKYKAGKDTQQAIIALLRESGGLTESEIAKQLKDSEPGLC